MKVVLASESQSRNALDMLGLTYEVHRSTIDEKSIRDTDAAALRKKLAEAKARKVVSAFDDAVVASGDAVAAKDTNFSRSRAATTKRLNSCASFPTARSSCVTSLTVLRSDTGRRLSAVETSEIKFRRPKDRGFRD